MRHPHKGCTLLGGRGLSACLQAPARGMPGLGFWLCWLSEHCAPRPLAQCIWTQGQRRGKVVIFQMNVSELTWLPFLEPLITATGRSHCVRPGFRFVSPARFEKWIFSTLAGWRWKEPGPSCFKSQNREGMWCVTVSRARTEFRPPTAPDSP